jgi:hypothetical protein
MVREALRANGQRIAPSARQLGISRVTLYRIVSRLNLVNELKPDGELRSGACSAGKAAGDPTSTPTAGDNGVSELSRDCIER